MRWKGYPDSENTIEFEVNLNPVPTIPFHGTDILYTKENGDDKGITYKLYTPKSRYTLRKDSADIVTQQTYANWNRVQNAERTKRIDAEKRR